jgi:hypothetical protein
VPLFASGLLQAKQYIDQAQQQPQPSGSLGSFAGAGGGTAYGGSIGGAVEGQEAQPFTGGVGDFAVGPSAPAWQDPTVGIPEYDALADIPEISDAQRDLADAERVTGEFEGGPVYDEQAIREQRMRRIAEADVPQWAKEEALLREHTGGTFGGDIWRTSKREVVPRFGEIGEQIGFGMERGLNWIPGTKYTAPDNQAYGGDFSGGMRSLFESAVPTEDWHLATELIPGIGVIPGAAPAVRAGIRGAGRAARGGLRYADEALEPVLREGAEAGMARLPGKEPPSFNVPRTPAYENTIEGRTVGHYQVGDYLVQVDNVHGGSDQLFVSVERPSEQGLEAFTGRVPGGSVSGLRQVGDFLQEVAAANPSARILADPTDARRLDAYQRMGFRQAEGQPEGLLELDQTQLQTLLRRPPAGTSLPGQPPTRAGGTLSPAPVGDLESQLAQSIDLMRSDPSVARQVFKTEAEGFEAARRAQQTEAARPFRETARLRRRVGELTRRMDEETGALRTPEITEDAVRDIVQNAPIRVGNELRQLTAGLDVSNMLRQGWGTIRHGTEYLASVGDMVRGVTDEAYALARQAEIRDGLGAKHGLFIGDLPGEVVEAGSRLLRREENYAADFVGNLPGFKQSGRGNILFLNSQRDRVFNRVVDSWQRAAEAVAEGRAGPLQRLQAKLWREGDLDALGNYINRTSGRGTLGPLEGTWVETVLGVGIFSPRFQASRPQMVASMFNFKHPLVAIEAIKDFGTSFGATVSLLALANQSGLASVELNPLDSDFGQFRVGNTRIDPWAGLRPFANLTARLYAGHYKGGFPAKPDDLLLKFVRSKTSPLVGRIWDIMSGEDFLGRDVTPEQVASSFMPIFAQGIYDAAKEGLLGEALASMPAQFFGLGANTYQPSETERRSPELQSAIDLYFEADDQAFQVVKATNPSGPYAPLLRESKSVDDFNKQLREIVQAANQLNPRINVDSTMQRVREELGLTAAKREVIKMAIKRDPGLLKWIEASGEYDAAQWMYDYAEELQKVAAK